MQVSVFVLRALYNLKTSDKKSQQKKLIERLISFSPFNEQTASCVLQGWISPTYLRAAFMPVAPKNVRIQSSCQYLFMLLGSTGAKAACGTLMKLTPGIADDGQLCTTTLAGLLCICIGCNKGCFFKVPTFIDQLPTAASCCRFHHHFTSSFCTDILLPKNYKYKL